MPKSQQYYTTSQAGKLHGVTDDTIRRWAAEGRIEAETTPASQMRIPVDEIRRVRAEGKLMPRAAPSAPRLRSGSEAARLTEQLEAERLQLRLERLRQQREETERRTRLEEQQRRQEEQEAERLEHEREEAERRAREDRERRQSWLRRAARRFESLPAEERLAAMQVFEQRLSALDPLPDDGYLARLLDAVEEAARLPGRVEADNQRLMQRLLEEQGELAREKLYAGLRDRAMVRMHEALRGLGLEASLSVREAAARQAMEPVVAEYRRRKLCRELGAGIDESLRRAGATAEEREQAQAEWQRRSQQRNDAGEAGRRAAAFDLEQAMRGLVEERQLAERERRRQEEARLLESVRQAHCRRLARMLLCDIVPGLLRRLERDGELEFDSSVDYRETCQAIQTRLEDRVARLLLDGADPVSAGTRRKIEQMVDAEVDEVAEPVDDQDAED